MNKKIVFSLAVLSTFSNINAEELSISGASDCLSGNISLDNLKKCTTLRKDPKQDDFYIQCVSNERDIAYESGEFHLINILTQNAAASQPEKVRYEALRKCGMTYYDSRMAAAFKAQVKHRANLGEANDFISSYKNLLNNTKNLSNECKAVYNAEKQYISDNSKSLNNLDLSPYYKVLGVSKPNIIDLKNGSREFKKTVKLLTDVRGENNDRKVVQEFYQEFKTYSTGRVMVSSSMNNEQEPYIVYLLDQQEPKAYVGDGWYPDIFRHFSDIIGDFTLSSNNVVSNGKGCSYIDDKINSYESPRREDSNKLIYVDERYDALSMQGVCDAYRGVFEKGDRNSYDFNRAKEMFILKNSKIKPFNYSDYFADYNDSKNNNRTNDYKGGVNKCYNYDLEKFTSTYSRASYFDWLNTRSFAKDNAFSTWQRQHGVFSIHKNNGNHKGVFTDDTGNELQEYYFSVNARPSFKPDRHGFTLAKREIIPTVISELKVKFVPDANYFTITDSANQDSITKALKATSLDDVYISLNNNKMPFTAADRVTDEGDLKTSIKYYMTEFELTKEKISNVNGPVSEKPVNIKTDLTKIELFVKEDIKGFGLKFGKEAFKKLVNITDKEIEDGNRYSIKLTPKVIVEEITERYQEHECPTSGNCKAVTKERKYTRPMYQESGVDIVKGSSKGNIEIILGGMNMPKGATLGSAYTDENNIVIDDKEIVSSKVKIADKIYTRTNEQNIFLGFKLPSEYSVENRYIKFLNEDNTDLNAKVFSKGYKLQKEVGNNDKTCNGYYKLSNEMIIQLNKKLPVSQNNKFRYKIAEFDKIFDECVELGSKESNEFTIRPEEIKYKISGKDSFDKNAGKIDDRYLNNNVTFTADIKDDKFGIGIAELRVAYAKPLTGVKTFNLEDENANLLNRVDNTTTSFVNFNKNNGNFAIKTVFPMVTDAKILLAENKFTYEDLKDDLCKNTNESLYKHEANKIGTDGKINCQTPGNEIDVNFTASQSFSLEKDTKGKDIKVSVTNTHFVDYVPFSDLDGERLRIPLQVANTNNGSYFYKKYDSNTIKAELNLTYKTEPKDVDKIIIKTFSDLDVKATSKKNVFELSGLNDKFNDKLTALNIADKLSSYNDSDFDAKNFAKFEYKIGYPKTIGGKPNLVREFVISNADSKITFANGKEEVKNNIFTKSEEYRFAYTGLFFKDIKVSGKSVNTHNIESTSAGLLKYVENKGFEKINTKVNNFEGLYNNAIGSFNLISDYSRSSLSGNKYEIPNNLKHNQYVKDTIRFNIKDPAYKYLDSYSTFTIEFIK